MQEKVRSAAEERVIELEARVKELDEQLSALRERSVRLVDMERRRCLEYVPSKGKSLKSILYQVCASQLTQSYVTTSQYPNRPSLYVIELSLFI